MFAELLRIQREAKRLLNDSTRDETKLDTLVDFINTIGPWEVVNQPGTFKWVIRNKKTLKGVE